VAAAQRDSDAAAAAAQRDKDAAYRQVGLDTIADLETRRDRVGRIGQLVENLFWRLGVSDETLARAE
jgi:hypothetical protein